MAAVDSCLKWSMEYPISTSVCQGVFKDNSSFSLGYIGSLAAVPFGVGSQHGPSASNKQWIARFAWIFIIAALVLGFLRKRSFRYAQESNMQFHVWPFAIASKLLAIAFASLFGILVGDLNANSNLLEVLVWIVPGLLFHRFSPELVQDNCLAGLFINTVTYLPGLITAAFTIWSAVDFSALVPVEAWKSDSTWRARETSVRVKVFATAAVVVAILRQMLGAYSNLVLSTKRKRLNNLLVRMRDAHDNRQQRSNGEEGRASNQASIVVQNNASVQNNAAIHDSPAHNRQHRLLNVEEGRAPNQGNAAVQDNAAVQNNAAKQNLARQNRQLRRNQEIATLGLYGSWGLPRPSVDLDWIAMAPHAILVIIEFVIFVNLGWAIIATANIVKARTICSGRKFIDGIPLPVPSYFTLQKAVACAKPTPCSGFDISEPFCQMGSFGVALLIGSTSIIFSSISLLWLPCQFWKVFENHKNADYRVRNRVSDMYVREVFSDQVRELLGTYHRGKEDWTHLLPIFLLLTVWQPWQLQSAHNEQEELPLPDDHIGLAY